MNLLTLSWSKILSASPGLEFNFPIHRLKSPQNHNQPGGDAKLNRRFSMQDEAEQKLTGSRQMSLNMPMNRRKGELRQTAGKKS